MSEELLPLPAREIPMKPTRRILRFLLAGALENPSATPQLRPRLGRRERERVVADFDLRRNAREPARMFRPPSTAEDGVPGRRG